MKIKTDKYLSKSEVILESRLKYSFMESEMGEGGAWTGKLCIGIVQQRF